MTTAQPPGPDIVIVSGSALPEWLQIVVALSTPITAVVGAVAAFAAVRASRAAVTQAKKSTDAANRSLEALGRSLAPQGLIVTAWLGRQPFGDVLDTPSPTLLRIRVFNRGDYPGLATVSISTPGGATRLLSPSRRLVAPKTEEWFELDDFTCGTADQPFDAAQPVGQAQATVEHLITLDYTDTRELLHWRQLFRADEVLAANTRQVGHTNYYGEIVEFRMCRPPRPESPTLVVGPPR